MTAPPPPRQAGLAGDRRSVQRLMARGLRPWAVLALLVACAGLARWQTFEAETVLTPPGVREALESQLDVALAKARPVDSVATLTDVVASYALRAQDESLLVVVFNSAAATVQITGDGTPRHHHVVIVRNVVAVYRHERGATSRLAQLRTALRRLDRAAA